ncbi:STAS domain-containing protein [Clostridium cylindrosporum]|uniref:RsbT antagonist protein RsbS n=1 Tax=Clostridium cylindrosporum DSM 605 TaxID=1121307 RepID=A0A0J8DCL0_CLOCY|nr:STAS domain-containing protein [Clostridium cylindrosporum]KMT21998.1 RsbT antagonist protein RsbS [Clostridium cylindrosporum DSM 605]
MVKIPILKINDILIVSIQEELTDKVALKFQMDILNKIYSSKAKGVLMDISLLDIVDSFLGKVISETAKMIRLLGAELVLVGMKPEVAITIVELGLEINGVHTSLNIEDGIENLNNIIKSKAIQEITREELLKEEKHAEI